MKLLENKTAIVTGGSRGIGKAIVQKFVESGASVAFTYRSSEDKAKALEKELNNGKTQVQSYQSDASSFDETEEFVSNVVEDFDNIDVVVNNAGVTQDNLLLRMKEEQWDSVIDNNLKSVFNLTKHVSRYLLKNRGGSIINLSSVVGLSGNPGQSNYASSKAGIIGFTKSIARELASRNIRCNAIAPGFIETEMTEDIDADTKKEFAEQIPLQRYGNVEEVANTALFLASDLGSYVNGQVISVCGGLHT